MEETNEENKSDKCAKRGRKGGESERNEKEIRKNECMTLVCKKLEDR